MNDILFYVFGVILLVGLVLASQKQKKALPGSSERMMYSVLSVALFAVASYFYIYKSLFAAGGLF